MWQIKWHIKCLVLEIVILAAAGLRFFLSPNLEFWGWAVFTAAYLAVMIGVAGLFGDLISFHVLFSYLVGLYLHSLIKVPVAIGALAWLVVLFALWRS